jgi:hypothetical protein
MSAPRIAHDQGWRRASRREAASGRAGYSMVAAFPRGTPVTL